MVDRDDENRDWPAVQMWTSGSGADQRHLYGFSTVSVGTKRGVPVYRFLRTLDPDEPDPELGLRIR